MEIYCRFYSIWNRTQQWIKIHSSGRAHTTQLIKICLRICLTFSLGAQTNNVDWCVFRENRRHHIESINRKRVWVIIVSIRLKEQMFARRCYSVPAKGMREHGIRPNHFSRINVSLVFPLRTFRQNSPIVIGELLSESTAAGCCVDVLH